MPIGKSPSDVCSFPATRQSLSSRGDAGNQQLSLLSNHSDPGKLKNARRSIVSQHKSITNVRMYLQDWGTFVYSWFHPDCQISKRTINQSQKYTKCHVQDQALLPVQNPYGSIWPAHPLRSQHSRTHELLFILVAKHLQCHLLWSWLYDHRDLPAQLLKGLGDPKFPDS